MATRIDLELREGNDEDLTVSVTTNRPDPGTVLDLAGADVEVYLKAAAATPDADPGVWRGTTTSGEVVVTDAAAGEFEVSIPGAAVTPTKGWWRADVLKAGRRKTAVYGTVEVLDL